jgi:hypothetical protein
MMSSMICNARVVTVNIHRSGHKIPNRVCKHVLTHTSSAIETILESIAALCDIAARLCNRCTELFHNPFWTLFLTGRHMVTSSRFSGGIYTSSILLQLNRVCYTHM